MACPNTNHQSWKDLVAKIGIHQAFEEFIKHGETVPSADKYPQSFTGVAATTKVVNALMQPEAEQLFKRFFDKDPDKFYREINGKAPREQVQLLREWSEKNNPKSVQDMLTGLLAETSYTVKIDTAKKTQGPMGRWNLDSDEWEPDGLIAEGTDGSSEANTSYYSSLTVPGGTNYEENEIATPAIEPSIRGHAQFATKNGIGWFRSDEKQVVGKHGTDLEWSSEEEHQYYKDLGLIDGPINDNGLPTMVDSTIDTTKTRRILEVQSDLFQKGRDKNVLITNADDLGTIKFETKYAKYSVSQSSVRINHENGHNEFVMLKDIGGRDDENLIRDLIREYQEKRASQMAPNQFLQLLNQNNNWQSFFVKSIIQDSARRGYEKVQFPTGDTAAKVEGHATLAEHKATIQSGIDRIEHSLTKESIDSWYQNSGGNFAQAVSNSESVLQKALDAKLSDKSDHFINPKIVDSQYNFVRIRQNHYNSNATETITGDSYNGWVLHQYTVGRGNKIDKISDSEAEKLFKKDNILRVESDKKQLSDAETEYKNFVDNEEQVKSDYREQLRNELSTYEQQLAAVNNGTSKLYTVSSFYENTVANILRKSGYNPERVIDEHGNQWNEVTLSKDHADAIVLFNRNSDENTFEAAALAHLKSLDILNSKRETIAGKTYWVVKRTEPGSFNREKGVGKVILFDNLEKIHRINAQFKEKNGWSPYSITKLTDATYAIEVNKQGALFAKDPEGTRIAKEQYTKIADALSKATGVTYKIISAAEAQELLKDTKHPWNGEGGFMYNNVAHFLDTDLKTSNLFHEFAHPFIAALREKNSYLYDKLFTEIMHSQDEEVRNTVASVANNYADYMSGNKHDTNILKDEVMVAMLTKEGLKQFIGEKPKNLVQRILFGIKQLLRSIFGQTVKIENLTAGTTLADMADMLYIKQESIDLDKTELYHPVFNREMAQELSTIDNHVVVEQINRFFDVLKDHSSKLTKMQYASLRDAAKKEDTDENLISSSRNLLRLAKEFEDNAELQKNKLYNFAQAVIGVRMFSGRMRDHVREIMDNPDASEVEKLKTVHYYSHIVKDWKDTFNILQGDLGEERLPLLQSEIDQAMNNFQAIDRHTLKLYKNGLVELVGSELEDIKAYANRELLPQVQKLQAQFDAGDKSVEKMLDAKKKQYEKYKYSDDDIASYINGTMGDTNPISAMVESYTSSPDPIVGSFANYLERTKLKAESWLQGFSTNLENELAPHYKELAIDRSKPDELGTAITQIDLIPSKDDKGNTIPFQVRSFMNEFKDGWLFHITKLEKDIEAAKLAGEDETEKNLRAQLRDMQDKYFHREYLPKVYEVKNFWWKNDINEKAYKAQKAIKDNLRSFNEQIETITEDDIADIARLQRELKTLGSTKNLDGSEKQGEALDIANAIKEYRTLSKDLYGEYEIKGAFQRDLQTYKEGLLDNGMVENSPDFSLLINSWIKDNIRISLSEDFYRTREAITDEIKAITSAITNKNVQSRLDIAAVWKDTIEQVKGFRDENGQPLGTEMEADKVKAIKANQVKIEEMKENLRRINNLSPEEENELNDLLNTQAFGQLDAAGEQRMNTLFAKKRSEEGGLSKADRAKLTDLFNQLKELQSKIPTDAYVETVNEKLAQYNSRIKVDLMNAQTFLHSKEVNALMNLHGDFKDWVEANHIKVNRYDPQTHQVNEEWERLYIWNRIVPNDKDLINALSTNNYEKLLGINNRFLTVKKASKYYFYRIKNEHRNERLVGKTVDNRGNWLPKSMQDRKAGTDDRFINHDYLKLRDSQQSSDKALYSILETYKKHHLTAQEGVARYGRLWLEVPRIRKERFEEARNLTMNPKATISRMIDYAKGIIGRRVDDLDRSQMQRKDIEDENKLYVSTDLFGNEIPSIPVRHMSKLDVDKVSLDVGRSVVKYASTVQVNKMLHDINPVAKALMSTLEAEGVRNVNKISLKSLMPGVRDKSPYVRLRAIRNLYEKEFEGVESKMELGLATHKIMGHLMGISAVGSLALNLPSSIKNLAAARIQNMLEVVSGVHIKPEDIAWASREFFTRFVPAMVKDYNAFGNKSLETQLFELADPVQGKFAEHAGERFSGSYTKDIINLRFLTSGMKLGELNAQGTGFMAMLHNTWVPFTENGITRNIRYSEAWELRGGVAHTKMGVDPTWDSTGDSFLRFKNKVHKVNELLQGAYAKSNQAEMQRYTSVQGVTFMRRFFIPGFVNRFAKDRPNIAIGRPREGYYQTFLRVMRDEVFGNRMKNWGNLTAEEKGNTYRVFAEAGYSLAFAGCLALLGFNSSDPDRFKKLKNRDWAHNMLIYQLMLIKSEEENFIPPMGLNDLLRMKDQPSIAFPLINKYYKVLSHMMDLVEQPFTDEDIIHYQKSSGLFKKGDLKLSADLLKIIGFSGSTINPALGIKNYSATMNRYN